MQSLRQLSILALSAILSNGIFAQEAGSYRLHFGVAALGCLASNRTQNMKQNMNRKMSAISAL